MAHDLYEGVSLDGKPNSIRILQLSTDQTKPLEGQLKEVSLASNPNYSALSYTWGENSDPPDEILCHASSSSGLVSAYIKITANCCDALTQLRRDLAPRGRPLSFNIWVDAICIDQTENGRQEKLAQIPLMREIYAKAKCVYIWLGLGTESSEYAMDWIKNASLGEYPLSGVKMKNFPANLVYPGEWAKLARLAPELIKAVYHRWNPRRKTMKYNSQHFRDIFLRPWFTRMWTVQELIMASEPIVVCGSKSMRWNSFFWGMVKGRELEQTSGINSFLDPFNYAISVTSFWYDLYSKEEFSQPVIRTWANKISQPFLNTLTARFLDFLQDHGRHASYIESFVAIAIGLGRIAKGLRPLNSVWIVLAIWSIAVTRFFSHVAPSNEWMDSFRGQLISILNMTRCRQASEPRDKVYALYGVLTSFDVDLPLLMENAPFEEVYHDFTKRIIDWHKSLDILLEAGAPPAAGESRLQNTPSWVPDWRWPLDRISKRPSRATKDSSPWFTFSESGLEIHTKGIVVDTLDSITSIATNLPAQDDLEKLRADLRTHHLRDSITALCVWIQDIQRLQQPKASDPIKDVIFEVLHSNTDHDVYHSEALRGTFHRWYEMVAADFPTLGEIYSTDEQIAMHVANDEEVYRYHLYLLKGTAGRNLFTTKQGYIGTGPKDVEKGDDVVLITGLANPMIVRGKGEREWEYMVVGAAHVHEVMKGDVWPSDDENLMKIVLV